MHRRAHCFACARGRTMGLFARPLNSDVRRPSGRHIGCVRGGKSAVNEGGTEVVHGARAESGFVRRCSSFDRLSGGPRQFRSAHQADAHAALRGCRDGSNPAVGARRSQGEYVGLTVFGEFAMSQPWGSSNGFVMGTSNFRWSGRRVRWYRARVRASASQARHARTGRLDGFHAAAQL